MALKIVDAGSATVTNIVAVIYAMPGVGKSSWCFSAENPILFDFDRGAHRAANRTGKALVSVSSWKDVEAVDAADLAEYQTVCIDTVGTALDTLAQQIMDEDSKFRSGLTLTLLGYGKLAGSFAAFVQKIKAAGKDLVFVAHMEETEKRGETVDRIIATGKSKQLIYGAADFMGRMNVLSTGDREFDPRPSATAFGKDPGIGVWKVPAPDRDTHNLSSLIHTVKKVINERSEENREEQEKLESFRGTVGDFTNVAQFNVMIENMIETDATPQYRKILVDQGKDKGFTFNAETKRFDAPAEAAGTF